MPRFVQKPEDEASAYSQVRKRVAFRGLDDIRIRVLGGDRFQVGAVTGWITKRDQDDADFLKGMGDIDGGLVAGAYSAFTLGSFTFDAAYLEKLTGSSAGPQYRFGIETTFVDATDLDAIRAAVEPGRTRLIWLETPANPLWHISDIAAVAQIVHGAGALLAVDSTCASPALTRPLALGADGPAAPYWP